MAVALPLLCALPSHLPPLKLPTYRSKGELTAPETPVSNLDDIKAKMALLDNPLPVVVVDVLDFPSLVDLELLDKLHLRRIPLSIIVNKYDLMPGDVRVSILSVLAFFFHATPPTIQCRPFKTDTQTHGLGPRSGAYGHATAGPKDSGRVARLWQNWLSRQRGL